MRPFTKDITVGKLNKAGTMFTGEQYDVTQQVMYAVKEYVAAHGNTAFEYADGTTLELRIEKHDD